MRKSINALVAVLAGSMTLLVSCMSDTIGTSIADTRSTVVVDSSFTITGYSVPIGRVQSRTSMHLLGDLDSEGYGHLSSDVVTQFMPAARMDTVTKSADQIDSCRLVLRIPGTNGFTGDSLSPMRLTVFQLTKQLPNPIYSDFDPTGYYDENEIVGSTAYSARSAKWNSDYTGTAYREVYIPLDVSVARSLFNEYKENPETFNSPTTFAEFFPGLYIANTYASGRVTNFNGIGFQVFYHYSPAGKDTVIVDNSHYLGSTPEVVSNNIIELTVDETVKQRVARGEAIVMSPGGYEVKVNFPIQEIIDRYYSASQGDLSIINTLKMEIPAEKLPTGNNIAPPNYLLMVKETMRDNFIAGDSLTNNKDSFYATYDADTKSYQFNDMRPYVMNIINKKGGIATDEDIHLVLMPVDVTTYTYNTSSSIYYSGTSTSTVTKIAPAVSVPNIVKLRLDKAKISMSFSRQSLF